MVPFQSLGEDTRNSLSASASTETVAGSIAYLEFPIPAGSSPVKFEMQHRPPTRSVSGYVHTGPEADDAVSCLKWSKENYGCKKSFIAAEPVAIKRDNPTMPLVSSGFDMNNTQWYNQVLTRSSSILATPPDVVERTDPQKTTNVYFQKPTQEEFYAKTKNEIAGGKKLAETGEDLLKNVLDETADRVNELNDPRVEPRIKRS